MEIVNIETLESEGRRAFRLTLDDGKGRHLVEVDAAAIVSRKATATAILAATGKLASLPPRSAWNVFIARWLGGSSGGEYETKTADIAAPNS